MKTTNEAYNEAMRDGREDQASEMDDLELAGMAHDHLAQAMSLLADAREQSPILWSNHLNQVVSALEELELTISLAELRA